MNKFGILLCFLAISFSQSALPEIDSGVAFDIYVTFMKGMSETSEAKCANTFIKHKDKLAPFLQEVWEDIKKGQTPNEAIMNHASELADISGDIETNCHAIEKIKDFAGFTKAKGIQQIGYNIIQNSVEIESLIQELLKASGFEGKIFVVGKIFKVATGLSFQ